MEGAILSREPLANDFRVLINEDSWLGRLGAQKARTAGKQFFNCSFTLLERSASTGV